MQRRKVQNKKEVQFSIIFILYSSQNKYKITAGSNHNDNDTHVSNFYCIYILFIMVKELNIYNLFIKI